MRITFIAPCLYIGGGVKVMAIYARQLTRMGHRVRIVSQPPTAVAPLTKIKAWLGRGDSRPRARVDISGLDHRELDRCRPITNSDVPEADVVIATWWETAEWVNFLDPEKGVKVYFIQHHEVFPYLPIERSKATYRMPFHKIVVSKWLKELMSVEYDDGVVDLVPNSVDRSQFSAPVRGKQRRPTVGFLYATAPFKGLDISLSAVSTLRRRMPNLRVICFGSEDPMSQLPDGMEFVFCPPQAEIAKLYAECDVWIAASRSEGFNLPAVEAMACRTPIVSTRTGWPAEAVKTGWNGVLVEVDDLASFTDGIEWVLVRSEEEWRILSDNAYNTTLAGSWEYSAKLFERALEHACQRSLRGEILGKCQKSAIQ